MGHDARWIEVDGEGPAIVLLHGNSASSEGWRRVMRDPALAGRRLVAIDWPGHGASPPAPRDDAGRYGLRWYAEVLAETLVAARAQGGVIVGHSLGGHVALEALARGLVADARGIVALGAPPLREVAELPTLFRPAASMGSIFEATLDDAAIATWAREAFGPHVAPPPWFVSAVRATDPEARSELGARISGEGIADELAAALGAPMPVVVVHATDDAYVADEAIARVERARSSRCRVVRLPGLGHYAHWEAPARVAAILAALVDEVGADAGAARR